MEDADDENHESALDFREKIRQNKTTFRALCTSNYIIDETLTLLKDRCGVDVAISFRQDLEASTSMTILWLNKENEAKAWKTFKAHKDKTYSFTDCTSFAMMEEHGIRNAFAFDRHFRQYGLQQTSLRSIRARRILL